MFGVWFPIVMDWQASLSYSPVAAAETVLRSKGKFPGSECFVCFFFLQNSKIVALAPELSSPGASELFTGSDSSSSTFP